MNETNNDLVREATQMLGDYEQVELGLLRLVTWNQKRRDLLERLDLLRELASTLADYDLIGEGHIERETWRQKMALVLARAKAAGVEAIIMAADWYADYGKQLDDRSRCENEQQRMMSQDIIRKIATLLFWALVALVLGVAAGYMLAA